MFFAEFGVILPVFGGLFMLLPGFSLAEESSAVDPKMRKLGDRVKLHPGLWLSRLRTPLGRSPKLGILLAGTAPPSHPHQTTRTPKGMLFGGFWLHKTNQKAFLWVSWKVFLFSRTRRNRPILISTLGPSTPRILKSLDSPSKM